MLAPEGGPVAPSARVEVVANGLGKLNRAVSQRRNGVQRDGQFTAVPGFCTRDSQMTVAYNVDGGPQVAGSRLLLFLVQQPCQWGIHPRLRPFKRNTCTPSFPRGE